MGSGNLLVGAISGLLGVILGAWLTGRRERTQRKLAYIEKQLAQFYTPMLALRMGIKADGELRVYMQNKTREVWEQLSSTERELSREAQRKLDEKRVPEFLKVIEYDNSRFTEQSMPAYKEMLKVFRENLWLADSDTKEHYAKLVAFISISERILSKSLPEEIIQSVSMSESELQPFYTHLQSRHDELQQRLKIGQ